MSGKLTGVHVLQRGLGGLSTCTAEEVTSASGSPALSEYTTAVISLAVLGPILTVVPTLVLTRKYLKV